MTQALAAVLILLLTASASADGHVAGYIATGERLAGRVADRGGHPVAGAAVHVVTGGVEQVVRTDATGAFKVDVAKGTTTSAVFVYGDVTVAGTALTSVPLDGSEGIAVSDLIPPAVMPKPLSDPGLIPPFSMAAIDHDTWLRAWLMLDVDERGAVARVKLLDAPGYDLDAIAVAQAFKLKFDPARDRSNHPVRMQVVWTFEWPEYYWLRRETQDMWHMPGDAGLVPCRGSGPTHTTYRDCSPPSVARALSRPWIDRPSR